MNKYIVILIIFLIIFSCKKQYTNTHIIGNVYNANTNEPINNVEVGFIKQSIIKRRISDKTNKKGKFKIYVDMFEDFEIKIFPIIENIQANQYEGHEFICNEASDSCSIKKVKALEDQNISFFVIPTGKLRFSAHNLNHLNNISELHIKFPEALLEQQHHFIFEKSELNELYYGNQFFGQTVTYIGDKRVNIEIDWFRNDTLIKTETHEVYIEKYKSSEFKYEI